MKTNEIFARVRKATAALVLLHPERPQDPYTVVGTGFCIDSSGIIVTCRHVVSAFMDASVHERLDKIDPADRKSKLNHLDNLKIRAPFVVFLIPGDEAHQIKAVISPVDQMLTRTDYDLAIVRTPSHDALQNGYPTVEIENYDEISEGDEVATCGYPLGNFLFKQIGSITSSFTRGSLSSIIPSQGISKELLKRFQLNLTATFGNSGGPVFSVKTGNVFGVLQGGILDQRGAILPGLSKAEPVYPIINPRDIALMKSAPRGQHPSHEAIKKAWDVPH